MLRRVLFVALWASLFGLTSRAVADNASAVPVWAMQGGDPGHTNQSSLLAPQTDIHKLWKVDLGADSFCQPVIGATGTIYVTNDLGQLIAVSPQGQKLWTFSGASIKASPPTIGNDGTIYFGSGDYVSEGNNAYVYAVNPDGTQRWRANTGSSHPYSPLIDLQGRIHVTTWTQSGTGSYYCLNPDGSRAWSGQGIGSPALLPNGSTVVQMRTGFRCYNSSGTAVWTAVFGYSLDAPIVAGNGDLYAACYDATAWKIDPATGAKLQTINTGLNAVANLSIDDDSHRLYLSDDTYLRSFDLSGNLQWSYSGTGGRSGPALIDAAGNLLSAQGQLGNGIDYISSSGSLLWHFAADEPAHHFGTPTLGTGGVVYATNWTYNGSSGYLYAVVPEPSTLALLGIGALGLFGYCCQRRKVSPRLVTCFAAVVVALSVAFAQAADVFNMGTGQTSLLTVPVGDAGNVADTAPQGAVRYGAVGYKYDIGKYDVTNAQYCEFLNAKASASDPYGLWSSRMASDACGGITCSGSGPYTYAVKPGQGSQPVVFASWYDTLRFANWLTNGQGSGSTESGAYAISGSGPYWTVAVPSAAQRA
ncbi:MAG: PQQ-binding-like beta-propeller repeat protein, partial [Thermoguttaceae bacterium]